MLYKGKKQEQNGQGADLKHCHRFFYLYFFVDSSQQHVCGFIEVNFKAKALHPALPFPSPQLLLDTSLEL